MKNFVGRYERFFVKNYTDDQDLMWEISLGLKARRYDPEDFTILLDEAMDVSEMLFV